MELLLTILSVLAVWAFLGVLIFGLLFVIKVLQGIRRHMEKIAMGVRAIEHQTRHLGRRADAVAASLTTASGELANVTARLQEGGS